MTTLQDNAKLSTLLYDFTIQLKEIDLKRILMGIIDYNYYYNFIYKNTDKIKYIYNRIQTEQNINIDDIKYYCDGYLFSIYNGMIKIDYVSKYILYNLFSIYPSNMDINTHFNNSYNILNIYRDNKTIIIRCQNINIIKIIAIFINVDGERNFVILILSAKRKYINNLPIELYNYIKEEFITL